MTQSAEQILKEHCTKKNVSGNVEYYAEDILLAMKAYHAQFPTYGVEEIKGSELKEGDVIWAYGKWIEIKLLITAGPKKTVGDNVVGTQWAEDFNFLRRTPIKGGNWISVDEKLSNPINTNEKKKQLFSHLMYPTNKPKEDGYYITNDGERYYHAEQDEWFVDDTFEDMVPTTPIIDWFFESVEVKSAEEFLTNMNNESNQTTLSDSRIAEAIKIIEKELVREKHGLDFTNRNAEQIAPLLVDALISKGLIIEHEGVIPEMTAKEVLQKQAGIEWQGKELFCADDVLLAMEEYRKQSLPVDKMTFEDFADIMFEDAKSLEGIELEILNKTYKRLLSKFPTKF